MSKFTKKNKEHLDSMVIGQGHTIMAGYIPEAVGAQTFSENYYKWKNPTPDSIAQFGFWGGDIDYNTYYPNLDKSELTPKDEEFIEPMFRLLSETIVSKNWNPTDFGQNGVLKASMKMLLGQTVNCDHETNIGNAIGAVSQVMWQESYKDGSFTIPAGINGILKIDGKPIQGLLEVYLWNHPQFTVTRSQYNSSGINHILKWRITNSIRNSVPMILRE